MGVVSGSISFLNEMAFKLVSAPQEHDSSETVSLEKEQVAHVEDGISEQKRKYLRAGLSSEDADFLLDLTPKQQSAIYHKVDIRLVPMLALLYLISHIDRANIGN